MFNRQRRARRWEIRVNQMANSRARERARQLKLEAELQKIASNIEEQHSQLTTGTSNWFYFFY